MQSHSPYSESTPLSGDGAAGFNRWVDGIVKQTNGKGRIRVHIPGKTDGMAIDLFHNAVHPAVEAGSTITR
jgi:hypothetical protein